ncbi:MAG: PIG-L family deacetylase [Chloroflexi bacterium]|nr:PIG-L family deacetylase [Chloroflexota bacterium]
MVEPANGNAKRVMLIVAHPDDGEFMAAGTLAKWARQGSEICYVLCTSGDKGTSDPEMKPEELAAIREREQRGAAAVVGARDVVFLRYADGTLQNTLELRKDLVRQIRRYKPDILVCQDPTMRYTDGYINHPDHRAAGDAALDAVFPSARDYHVFPEIATEEGLMPHKTLEVYLGAQDSNATVWVDIADTIDVKIAALYEHMSQVGKDPERLKTMAERIKERCAEVGTAHAMRYAESFRYIHLR